MVTMTHEEAEEVLAEALVIHQRMTYAPDGPWADQLMEAAWRVQRGLLGDRVLRLRQLLDLPLIGVFVALSFRTSAATLVARRR